MDDEDIYEELERVILIKKLVTRLKAGKPNYRLILNHLVILHNCFNPAFVIFLLKGSIQERDWFIINTFLIYMRRSLDVVSVDNVLLENLRKEV